MFFFCVSTKITKIYSDALWQNYITFAGYKYRRRLLSDFDLKYFFAQHRLK